jgi:hypothetical protein
VRPEDVGLEHLDRRRVRGLRREEAAMLAGVGVDYELARPAPRRSSPTMADTR